MKRSLAFAALAAATCLTLAACGGSSSSPNADPNADPSTISGSITWWDTSDATNETPAFKAVVAKFEAAYPKIKVNYVNVPFADAENKFKTAAAGGSGAPDVFRSDVGWTPTFAALGYLQPLDGTRALTDESDYLPGPVATTKYDGKTYGSPEVTDTLGLLYNKKLFAQAGIASAPTTWTELKADAQLVEQKIPGTAGFTLDADSYFLLPFIYGEGGDYVDVASKKVTVNSDKVATAVDVAKSLATPGVGKTDTSTNGYTNMQQDFQNGKVAMIVNGPWSISDDLKGPQFTDPTNLGVAKVPAGSAGQGGPTGGHNLVVYAGSGQLSASYLFVQYVNSAESQAYISTKNNTLPTRASVYANPDVAKNQIVAAFKDPVSISKARPAVPGAGSLFDVITPYYQKILSGQAGTASGLADAQKAALPLISGFSG